MVIPDMFMYYSSIITLKFISNIKPVKRLFTIDEKMKNIFKFILNIITFWIRNNALIGLSFRNSIN